MKSGIEQRALDLSIYLLGFIIFVVPIAAAGLLKFGGLAPPDAFVLLLPMAFNNEPLAALAFLGGLSAATGMILVSHLPWRSWLQTSCSTIAVSFLLRGAQRAQRSLLDHCHGQASVDHRHHGIGLAVLSVRNQ